MLRQHNEVDVVFADNLKSFADMLEQSVNEMNTVLETGRLSQQMEIVLGGRIRKLERLVQRLMCVEEIVPRLLEQLDSLLAQELVRSNAAPELCLDECCTSEIYHDVLPPFIVPVRKQD